MSQITHNIYPVTRPDGVILCYCNEPAPLRTSNTNQNPNRDFYCCNKDRGDDNRCKFFKWKDELDRQAQTLSSSPIAERSQMLLDPPTLSQQLRAEAARGPININTPNPRKRERSPQQTPSRRLADIEAALSQNPHPSSHHTASSFDKEDDDTGTFFSSRSTPPRSFQSGAGVTHYHFHLPPPIPEIHSSSYDSPRSPKRPRLDRGESSRNNNMPITPPQTGRTETRNGLVDAPPESPLKGKGKERDDGPSMQMIQMDEDNPFHEPTASLQGLSYSTSGSFPASSHSIPTTTSGTPESIKALLSDLTTTLPTYIAKLERKQIAGEKSNEAKLKKIEELEKANKLLQNKIRVLEETVSALKARRPLSQ